MIDKIRLWAEETCQEKGNDDFDVTRQLEETEKFCNIGTFGNMPKLSKASKHVLKKCIFILCVENNIFWGNLLAPNFDSHFRVKNGIPCENVFD